MKQKIILALFTLLIPWNGWAFSENYEYKNGDIFTAYVPLNGNDSVEMDFYVISEEEKTIGVGTCPHNSEEFYFCDSSITPSINSNVEGIIEIPSSINGYTVMEIGARAFEGCYKLTSITTPHNITYIGRFAFGNCPNVYIPCLKVPELEYDGGEWWPGFWAEYIKVDAFSTDSKIYVPAMSQESYKNDYVWKTISNIIYAIEGETDYDVTIQAQEKTSDLSSVIGEENLGHVVSLK